MKILIIDESINRVGGVERILATLANKLSMNNEVHVTSTYKVNDEPFYKYNESVKINYLITSRIYKSSKLKNKGLLYYCYRVIEKAQDKLTLAKKIQSVITTFDNYDVIIFGRVFIALDYLRYLENKSSKYKIIVRDAINLKYYKKNVQDLMHKLFPKFVDTMIVSSTESINTYKEFFKSDINLVKIYNPLGITPTINYNFYNRKIVSIGRFDEQKGFDALIKAFAIISNQFDDWTLELYGSGTYENKLKNLILDLDLEGKVILKEPVKDVTKVLNETSIFVLPSRYEGYANALVESLACGVPSITVNWYMGAEEIIKDNENGLIVKLKNRDDYFKGINHEEDIQSLAVAMKTLIENPNVCNYFSNNAKEITKTREIDVIIKEWEKLI